jgi:hypothetical protein
MDRVVIHSQVGRDGVLNLKVPLGSIEADREVRVTIEPVMKPISRDEWRRHIREMAGSWQGDLVRPEQGQYEQRDEWS